MQEIELKIQKADVWEEVAKLASFTGDKLTDADAGAYERIMLTDEVKVELQRFWSSASSGATDSLKEWVKNVSSPEDDYTATLSLTDNWDPTLTKSAREALRNYFVMWVTGYWFKLANKEEADSYIAEAAAWIETTRRILHSRRRPSKPIYN